MGREHDITRHLVMLTKPLKTLARTKSNKGMDRREEHFRKGHVGRLFPTQREKEREMKRWIVEYHDEGGERVLIDRLFKTYAEALKVLTEYRSYGIMAGMRQVTL